MVYFFEKECDRSQKYENPARSFAGIGWDFVFLGVWSQAPKGGNDFLNLNVHKIINVKSEDYPAFGLYDI